jgi:G3E family GTPase
MFEQAGSQKTLMQAGEWFATLPKEESDRLRKMEPKLEQDWDPVYGDRMVKLVFIGKNMDKDSIIKGLNKCIK